MYLLELILIRNQLQGTTHSLRNGYFGTRVCNQFSRTIIFSPRQLTASLLIPPDPTVEFCGICCHCAVLLEHSNDLRRLSCKQTSWILLLFNWRKSVLIVVNNFQSILTIERHRLAAALQPRYSRLVSLLSTWQVPGVFLCIGRQYITVELDLIDA